MVSKGSAYRWHWHGKQLVAWYEATPINHSLSVLYVTSGCDRQGLLLFYGSGKKTSFGDPPTREHFLEFKGEKSSLHVTARLRSLPCICIARCSNLSKDCLTSATSLELRNCTDSTTKESSLRAVIITRASCFPARGGSSLYCGKLDSVHMDDKVCVIWSGSAPAFGSNELSRSSTPGVISLNPLPRGVGFEFFDERTKANNFWHGRKIFLLSAIDGQGTMKAYWEDVSTM